MHLDDERIERRRDDELEPVERIEADRHLADCAPCRERFERARSADARVSNLLRGLDPAASARPPLEAILARARVRPRLRVPRFAAAAALLVVVAGAAAALPGSPVRAWLQGWMGGAGTRPATSPTVPAPVAPAIGGVAVTPGARLVIELRPTGAGESARALVNLVEGEAVVVSAAPDVAAFDSEEGRLTVRVSGAGLVRIDVPLTAPEVEIRVHGRRAWRLAAGRVDASVPADSLGEIAIPLGE